MIAGLRACWRGLRHLNQRGYIYIWANVLWVLLSLPLITAPAAWAGLVKMSHRAHTERSADLTDFWQGFRENLRRSVVLSILNLVIIGINLSNLAAYQNQTSLLFILLRWIWIFALLFWVTLQFYMWPLLYEMKQPNLRDAMRNAVIMILLNPGFTIGLWIGMTIVIVFSTVLVAAWLLLAGAALAAITTGAVLDRLVIKGLHPAPLAPLSEEEIVQ